MGLGDGYSKLFGVHCLADRRIELGSECHDVLHKDGLVDNVTVEFGYSGREEGPAHDGDAQTSL